MCARVCLAHVATLYIFVNDDFMRFFLGCNDLLGLLLLVRCGKTVSAASTLIVYNLFRVRMVNLLADGITFVVSHWAFVWQRARWIVKLTLPSECFFRVLFWFPFNDIVKRTVFFESKAGTICVKSLRMWLEVCITNQFYYCDIVEISRDSWSCVFGKQSCFIRHFCYYLLFA